MVRTGNKARRVYRGHRAYRGPEEIKANKVNRGHKVNRDYKEYKGHEALKPSLCIQKHPNLTIYLRLMVEILIQALAGLNTYPRMGHQKSYGKYLGKLIMMDLYIQIGEI